MTYRPFFLFLCVLLWGLPAHAQYTPDSIYTAARAGNLDRVKEILAGGSNQNMLNNTLGAAVAGNHPEIIRYLVATGANPNHLTSYNTPLLNSAIMYGFDDSALALIEAGADVSTRGFRRIEYNLTIEYNWTPLMCAARRGNEAIVERLLEHGADPTENGWSTGPDDIETPADVAAYSGHLDIMKRLEKAGSKISPTTIFKTVRGGHMNTFKYLLKEEKDINRMGPLHKTLLMEASWWGRSEMVRYLLKKKAVINPDPPKSLNALIEVVSNPFLPQKTQIEIARELIRHGANVRYKTEDGLTALTLARKFNRPDLIAFLQKSGAKN